MYVYSAKVISEMLKILTKVLWKRSSNIVICLRYFPR